MRVHDYGIFKYGVSRLWNYDPECDDSDITYKLAGPVRVFCDIACCIEDGSAPEELFYFVKKTVQPVAEVSSLFCQSDIANMAGYANIKALTAHPTINRTGGRPSIISFGRWEDPKNTLKHHNIVLKYGGRELSVLLLTSMISYRYSVASVHVMSYRYAASVRDAAYSYREGNVEDVLSQECPEIVEAMYPDIDYSELLWWDDPDTLRVNPMQIAEDTSWV